MTVAEQIKRSTKPLTVERWILAFKQKITFKLESYSQAECKNFYSSLRVAVWHFKFIDGSKITCRIYNE